MPDMVSSCVTRFAKFLLKCLLSKVECFLSFALAGMESLEMCGLPSKV